MTTLKKSICVKKNSNCHETKILMKFINSKCDETQKLKWWQNSKSQIVTKPKKSKCDKTQNVKKKMKTSKCDKTQIVTKLENSNYDKTLKLKFGPNSETHILTKLDIWEIVFILFTRNNFRRVF